MGVNVNTERDDYNDRCKWYKKTDVSKMKLTQDAVAQGIFYSKDTVALSETDIAEGNIKRKQFTITIETQDYIEELSADDFVMYSDDYIWRVKSITRDDKNESKMYSKRPSVKTTLELIR